MGCSHNKRTLRAKQTANIINKNINVCVIEREEFLERDYGNAEGMTYKKRASKFPDRIYPNQEERTSLNKRIIEDMENYD